MLTSVSNRQELLRNFFHEMFRIRVVEETLLNLFAHGAIGGTVHTCLGQEAVAVGVTSALNREMDIICSNHRGHGHFLAYCRDGRGLIAEILGQPSGVCGGIGGSQHLQKKNFYSNGILGGMAPVAVGMAYAEKLKGSGAVVVQFMGDGAMAEGAVYEALNMASLWGLPIMFAVENNQYAQSTHWSAQHSGALEQRSEAFGVPVSDIDGNDVEGVYDTARRLIREIRSQCAPRLLFMRTYRLGPHSKGDDLRDPQELDYHLQQEPLYRLRKNLDPSWVTDVERQVRQEVAMLVDDLRRS
ncbi:thiamine pyrophosphate-dependent dehydrogenase E1 component subunit alpha [Ferrovum sp.]|jgi:TPP-dependent pyruvate/acetoin dehydrogenase alpha subunit|uniref:thiamine pyrophosphate-dependent dehydrogenase E1 component subunit alpha n=1 Tax=Ferrovum sp. TaxID=2609467 RepID=UPI0026219715|nr:thiamine pyrophosphate-dependent dehydrogenase E1 component subunit alpha [Ferrovum sp.]